MITYSASKLSEAIKDDTSSVRNAISSLEAEMDAIRLDGSLQNHRKTMDWLSASNYPAQQSDIIARDRMALAVVCGLS